MGNFDKIEPTEEMINALTRLMTVLAIEFDINPGDRKTYFTPVDYEPYIVANEHSSIVGHKDTKITACPGENVYTLLPELRAKVAASVQFYNSIGED
jgi:hypothetical protein